MWFFPIDIDFVKLFFLTIGYKVAWKEFNVDFTSSNVMEEFNIGMNMLNAYGG